MLTDADMHRINDTEHNHLSLEEVIHARQEIASDSNPKDTSDRSFRIARSELGATLLPNAFRQGFPVEDHRRQEL